MMMIIVKRAVAAASRNRGLVHREASSATSSVRPACISLLKAPPPSPSYKGLELEYDQGQKLCFSAEFLRVHSPSADSMRTTARGKKRVIAGRRHVHILGIEPVGKYGIRIIYDDTHDTGIYTWNYLHDLGSKKFYYMREYIKSLWEEGLTREPGKKK
ncbi:unnamed protein product [Calypogeia fissa]